MALGINFPWIFIDFGNEVGAKLALKIDQQSIQQKHQKNCAKKMFQKKSVPLSKRVPITMAQGSLTAPLACAVFEQERSV